MSEIEIIRPVGSGLLAPHGEIPPQLINESVSLASSSEDSAKSGIDTSGIISVNSGLIESVNESVILAPSPNGLYPNEPLNFERIAEFDCSIAPPQGQFEGFEGTWNAQGNNGFAEILNNADLPSGLPNSDKAIRVKIPDGHPGTGLGTYNFHGWSDAGLNGEDPRLAFYRSVWIRPWANLESTGNNALRVWLTGLGNRHNGSGSWLGVSDGDGTPQSQWRLLVGNPMMNADDSCAGSSHVQWPNADGSRIIQLQQWAQIEQVYYTNDINVSNQTISENGIMRTWINGILHHDRNDFTFRGWGGNNCQRGFWQHRGTFQWGSTQQDKVGDGFIDLGHIYISAPAA
jgi:hypothetical protein